MDETDNFILARDRGAGHKVAQDDKDGVSEAMREYVICRK